MHRRILNILRWIYDATWDVYRCQFTLDMTSSMGQRHSQHVCNCRRIQPRRWQWTCMKQRRAAWTWLSDLHLLYLYVTLLVPPPPPLLRGFWTEFNWIQRLPCSAGPPSTSTWHEAPSGSAIQDFLSTACFVFRCASFAAASLPMAKDRTDLFFPLPLLWCAQTHGIPRRGAEWRWTDGNGGRWVNCRHA